MGSTTMFAPDRQLHAERRRAKLERDLERRQAREAKRARLVAGELTEIGQLLEVHEQERRNAGRATPQPAKPVPVPTTAPAAPAQPTRTAATGAAERHAATGVRASEATGENERLTQAGSARRGAARQRELDAFAQRRQQVADDARDAASELIEHGGEQEAVGSALDVLAAPAARPWGEDRARIEHAIATRDVDQVRRRASGALWAAARDAARTSRRARRDPQAARSVCTALAVLERLPRTAVRTGQRLTTPPRLHASVLGRSETA